MKILLIDHDERTIVQIQEALRAHTVLVIEDPLQALDKINNVDLVIFDVAVRSQGDEHMNGFIFMNRARKIRPDIRSILISRHYDENDEISRQVVHRYANTGLAKPFTSAAISQAVERVSRK